MILSNVISQLLGGMVTSIEIFLLTLLFSLPLGLAIAAGRMSNISPIRWLMKIYISIMYTIDASINRSVLCPVLRIRH